MDATDNDNAMININPTLARTSSLYLSSFIVSLSPPKDDVPQHVVVAAAVVEDDSDESIGVDDVDAMIFSCIVPTNEGGVRGYGDSFIG